MGRLLLHRGWRCRHTGAGGSRIAAINESTRKLGVPFGAGRRVQHEVAHRQPHGHPCGLGPLGSAGPSALCRLGCWFGPGVHGWNALWLVRGHGCCHELPAQHAQRCATHPPLGSHRHRLHHDVQLRPALLDGGPTGAGPLECLPEPVSHLSLQISEPPGRRRALRRVRRGLRRRANRPGHLGNVLLHQPLPGTPGWRRRTTIPGVASTLARGRNCDGLDDAVRLLL